MKFTPVATYRLQLRSGFGFTEAKEFIQYFHSLGISHLYLSPCLQAVKGSDHGYDVVDHSRLNAELGGFTAFDDFVAKLHEIGMGVILDIVPNHMALCASENPWWWDVLENGPSSNFARYFDVDWGLESEHFSNLILLPVLGDHYGIVLEAGEFKLKHDFGRFTLNYYDHIFPVAPRSIAIILDMAFKQSSLRELGFMADAFYALPHAASRDVEKINRRMRDKAVLNDMLKFYCGNLEFIGAVNAAVDSINDDYDLLDELIGQQNYKLAFWQLSKYQVGYRRFFNINSLVGLRIEEEQVFEDAHRLVFQLEKAGKIDGFRVDHSDGMFDPSAYFFHLRRSCPESLIFAEKILARGEELNTVWPVTGTTGYDFLNMVNGLFINPEGLKKLQHNWQQIVGDRVVYDEFVHQKKIRVIKDLLSSEINRLVSDLAQICENHRRYRDFSSIQLSQAVTEVAAAFSVYRTYIQPETGQVSHADRENIQAAIKLAKTRRPDHGDYIFDFLADIFLLKLRGERESLFVRRFQQFTGPVMAKSLEDTLFYIYNPLISVNEVGGHPFSPHVSVIEFHRWCENVAKKWPLTMLATSTHDTKRSEDVRARLNLLSEIPDRWFDTVKKWMGMNRKYKVGSILDANTEYLFYQTLVGTWPISLQRVTSYMEKAVREAKVHSSWARQNNKFEEDLKLFISRIFDDTEFVASFEEFVRPLIIPGRFNSLSQLTLKLTVPGLPDIYQGNEIWDNSLVDPDNRRPVDFRQMQLLLRKVENCDFRDILQTYEEGLPKLFVIKKLLELRRKFPVLNEPDSYRPVEILGSCSDNVVAFERGRKILVVVPLQHFEPKNQWDNTRVILGEGEWQNVFTGAICHDGTHKIKALLHEFPVAVLVKNGVEKVR